MSNRAIAYIRVSTDMQGRSGLGLTPSVRQSRTSVRGRALRSATLLSRWRLARARTRLIAGPHGGCLTYGPLFHAPIIVAKLDRLSRDVHFISSLMSQNVPFIVPPSAKTWTPSCSTSTRLLLRRNAR